ncbi:MAG TPA: ABC transporter [Microbacterium sp.]|uniref:ABC transporter n=1 Tax=Microbacterium sp. TaxID=51671 RepID=UPI000EC10313|nr:ABC transporter [Microbacterium sp.]
MSDPEVPRSEQPADVNDVVADANAGLADAEAAGADVSGTSTSAENDAATSDAVDYDAVDPDLAAFEEAERSHPGTFVTPGLAESAEADESVTSTVADEPAATTWPASTADYARADEPQTEVLTESQRTGDVIASDAAPETSIADTAYGRPVADDTETRVVPSEPIVAAAAPVQNQPIFVQAPEPPRDRGNRGTAAGIGLLATLVFAILYLAIGLGWSAIKGEVNSENIVEQILAPLTTWAFWVPVAVFFIGFWLLGAIINRGRWGRWVIFGILVGVISYGGYILGQLFEARFWLLSSSEATDLVGEQLFAPLAIAAFVLGRELTIWFGAWVARSGAHKTELNAEAQREYERTLEAGPTLSR